MKTRFLLNARRFYSSFLCQILLLECSFYIQGSLPWSAVAINQTMSPLTSTVFLPHRSYLKFWSTWFFLIHPIFLDWFLSQEFSSFYLGLVHYYLFQNRLVNNDLRVFVASFSFLNVSDKAALNSAKAFRLIKLRRIYIHWQIWTNSHQAVSHPISF